MFSIRLFFSTIVLTCVATAQQRPGRHLGAGWDGGVTRGDAIIAVGADGFVDVGLSTPSGYQQGGFQTGITSVGGYEAVGNAALEGLVIAGRDSSSAGRVEHWGYSSVSGWTLQSSLSVAGADFSGVAQVGPALFLLDCVTRSILSGAWDSQSALSAVSLDVYATPSEVAALAQADALLMYGLNPGHVVSLPGAGVFLCSMLETQLIKTGTLIRDGSMGLVVEPFVFSSMRCPDGVVAVESSAKSGDITLTVLTNGPQSFEVVSELGAVIGQGTGLPYGGEVQVSLSEPLALGRKYGVRLAGSLSGSLFVCVQRNGFPEVLEGGFLLHRPTLGHDECHVGNQVFSLAAEVSRPPFVEAQVFYFGAMTLGLSGTPIVPYDNGQGMNELLVADYWVGALGGIEAHAKNGFISMSFPIPANPAWEGVVLFGQFIVLEPSGFRLGEVTGLKIQQAPQ